MISIIILLQLLLISINAYNDQNTICSVCYASPCDFLNITSNILLYCSLFNTSQCGLCSLNCTQCYLTNSPYVCICPTLPPGTPTYEPTTKEPTTEEPTSEEPTFPPTEEGFTTNSPTGSPPFPPFPPTFQPTLQPPTTISPAIVPTPSITFNQCQFCNNTSPPPSLSCNGSSSLLMLCQLDNTSISSCTICPIFCSFCFPLFAPTPQYICTCPSTKSPTLQPTRSPTRSPTTEPTIAPTNKPKDNDIFKITIIVIVISFGVVLCILFSVCLIFVVPKGIYFEAEPITTTFYYRKKKIKKQT